MPESEPTNEMPNTALTIDAIKKLAQAAHAGQTDKAGRDYFEAHLTPIAAGAAIFGPLAVQAAWLHDIVEDTAYTVEQLADEGVAPEVVAAVDAVTRRDETYRELIDRACGDPVGRYVKLVDNAWNITCNPDLAARAAAEALLVDRYVPARRRLLAACDLDEESAVVQALQKILDSHRLALAAAASG